MAKSEHEQQEQERRVDEDRQRDREHDREHQDEQDDRDDLESAAVAHERRDPTGSRSHDTRDDDAGGARLADDAHRQEPAAGLGDDDDRRPVAGRSSSSSELLPKRRLPSSRDPVTTSVPPQRPAAPQHLRVRAHRASGRPRRAAHDRPRFATASRPTRPTRAGLILTQPSAPDRRCVTRPRRRRDRSPWRPGDASTQPSVFSVSSQQPAAGTVIPDAYQPSPSVALSCCRKEPRPSSRLPVSVEAAAAPLLRVPRDLLRHPGAQDDALPSAFTRPSPR